MDLKQYYTRIREAESALEGECVIVTSCETPDGGREGITSEVAKALAARMIVEHRARPANEEERREFYERASMARKTAEQAAAARRVQVHLVPDYDARATRRKE